MRKQFKNKEKRDVWTQKQWQSEEQLLKLHTQLNSGVWHQTKPDNI